MAGFGDFEVSRHCLPSLTTISIDGVELGRQTGNCVRLAIKNVESNTIDTSKTVHFPYALVARESS